MPLFEQFPQSYHSQFMLDEDQIKHEQFDPSTMDSYPTFDSISLSTDIFGTAQQDFKYEMLRSVSQSSFQQTAPSLLSSASAPSLPSASSSTVGSPQSGFAQTLSNHFIYSNQFNVQPAIICDDSYPYAYESGHFDHEAALGQEGKINVPFVGKCADLPFFVKRSPDAPVQEYLPTQPLVSSPKPMIAGLEATSSSLPQRGRSPDEAPQITSSTTNLRSQLSQNGGFKPPSTPASAYHRDSSLHAKGQTVLPTAEPPRDTFRFSYTFPFPDEPMLQHGSRSQYNFFFQTNGNIFPPIEASNPVLISAQQPPYLNAAYGAYQVPVQPQVSPAASPAPSTYSLHSFSAPVTIENFDQQHAAMRRQSICSLRSGASPRSTYSNDEESGKGRCPYPDCGRVIKDLKAHMMTHEMVRPEKCPIPSCEYHTKGFARKYDKNRHTLTHYRGTMVCGFCPGSGSAAEKSFNRADVFKRHLTTVHGVEQTPPNSRKRSPSKPTVSLSSYCQDATGKCSTCGASFNNAQDFYEHLDDCVLKVVQQEEPSEAVNARRLGEVVNDQDVQATFERNNIKAEDSPGELEEEDDEDDEEEDEDEVEFDFNERSGRGVIKTTKVTSNRPIIGGNVSKKTSKKGLTWSKGGGSIIGKSRQRRKFYPPSWGMATDKMNMKKRVLCVYDGQRRLLKDDIMMHNEFEVRMPLQDGNNYVTDLDLETMKRAEAFHNLSDADKGPWIQEQDFLQDFLE